MIFNAFAPPKVLQPFVQQYLYMQNHYEVEYTFPVIPRGLPALLLFLEPEKKGYVKYFLPIQKNMNFNEFYLYGQSTETFWLKILGNFKLFVIVLHPTAFHKIIGQSAAGLANTILSLNDLSLNSTHVVEQLLASNSLLQQLPVLDTFLSNFLNCKENRTDEVDGALNLILGSHGLANLNEINKRERVSARTLQRKFTERVGITPKAYLRLIRFRSMVQFIFSHPQVSWLDLTYKFGYYDQSHLIKDFYQYTGQSPLHYFQKNQKIDSAILKAI